MANIQLKFSKNKMPHPFEGGNDGILEKLEEIIAQIRPRTGLLTVAAGTALVLGASPALAQNHPATGLGQTQSSRLSSNYYSKIISQNKKIKVMDVSANGKYIAYSTSEKLFLYDTASKKHTATGKTSGEEITFLPSGEILMSPQAGGRGGVAYETPNFARTSYIDGPGRAQYVSTIAISPTGLIALGKETVLLYNPSTKARRLLGSPARFSHLQFSHNDELFAQRGDRIVQWRDTGNANFVFVDDLPAENFAIRKDGLELAIVATNSVRILRRDSLRSTNWVRQKIIRFYHKKNYKHVHALAYSPDGKYLATGDGQGGVGIYDGTSFELLSYAIHHKSFMSAVKFGASSNTLYSSSSDGSIIEWDTGKFVQIGLTKQRQKKQKQEQQELATRRAREREEAKLRQDNASIAAYRAKKAAERKPPNSRSPTPILDAITLGVLGTIVNNIANPVKRSSSSSSTSYADSPTPSGSAAGGSSVAATSGQASTKSGGYQFLEHITPRSGQKVVARGKCSDGTRFDVRYSANTGKSYRYTIYTASGPSKDGVAKKFCRNH